MDEMKFGMKIAYQGVKEEMETIVAELARLKITKQMKKDTLEPESRYQKWYRLFCILKKGANNGKHQHN